MLLAVISLLSCSDDFVDEHLDISGVAKSFIVISPEWDADNYQFQIETGGNAGFRIDRKPHWLSTNNLSGEF